MWHELSARLAAAGISHQGGISRARFDANAPPGFRLGELARGAESMLVAASAGRAFWDAFERHLVADATWVERQHPLDDFTRLTVERATHGLPAIRVFYPFFSFEPRLPFQKLGVLAHLGQPSPLGLLVHPTFGPWFALRAAIALPAEAVENTPFESPCDACSSKPCIAACPGKAVTLRGFDVATCVSRCRAGPPCATRCDARLACPVGRSAAYDTDAIQYHHTRGFLAPLPPAADGAAN